MSINIDQHKLQYHPERVTEWKIRGDCYPIYVEIGPTNFCNHRCIFCALDWVEKGSKNIDTDVMNRALIDMARHRVKSIMFAGEGEPFLHPDICSFINNAKTFGMDVSVTTNGVLFTKDKIKKCLPSLSWIRFSVDAYSPKTYSKIHGTKFTDFRRVVDNIRSAVAFKRKHKLNTVLGVQFLLIPQNIKEAINFAKFFKWLGVDNVQIKPYSQHPNSENRFIVRYKDYAYLEDKLKKLNSPTFKVFFRKETMNRIEDRAPYHECFGIPFFALIDAKGNIIPCNLFYNSPQYTYGNLYKESFSKIWEGKNRKNVLRKLRNKGCSKCREGCRLDVINRYLNRLRFPEEHDNFI